MREIVISRPGRAECSAAALRVEVNGKPLARLRNGQRIIMQVDDGPQEIRVHGGWLSGKAFQDTLYIPAGQYGYSFRVDFVSGAKARCVPVLRPCGGVQADADSRTITLLGAELAKRLLDEQLRERLRGLPGAHLQLVVGAKVWMLLLCYDDAAEEVFRSAYACAGGDFTAALVGALEYGDLSKPEGRAGICEKVLADYAACLPEYERFGTDGLVFGE